MKSDLARDLVTRGYIDRNFTLYAAQFYGDFTGVDVATFVVQTVRNNSMEIDFTFESDESVENLLHEAGPDFLTSVSAYNVHVLNYLLGRDLAGADAVVNQLVTKFGGQAQEFLTAYLTSGTQRSQLAARLGSRPWREVFTYLANCCGAGR